MRRSTKLSGTANKTNISADMGIAKRHCNSAAAAGEALFNSAWVEVALLLLGSRATSLVSMRIV